MAEMTVSGASDDLIHVQGVEGADEFNKVSGHWVGLVEAPNGESAYLYVDYRTNVGCWTAALGLVEEDSALPEWPVRVEASEVCAYSTLTTFTVPDGTRITEV